MTSLSFTVPGLPAAQGSKRAWLPKGMLRPIMVEQSKRLKPWRSTVALAAQAARGGKPWDFGAAYSMTLEFRFPRPQSHYGSKAGQSYLKPSAPTEHVQSPDLDKMCRAVFDALTGVLYHDDKQITRLSARRVYDEAPGCRVIIEAS